MKTYDRAEHTSRHSIMTLLSDEEVGRVSTAETATRLEEGDEFLDLKHLRQGVQTADGVTVQMGQILPRKAVLDATWVKAVALLEGIIEPALHSNQ